MQTSGTTNQSTRFPTVSGGSGVIAGAFVTFLCWFEDLLRKAVEAEDQEG